MSEGKVGCCVFKEMGLCLEDMIDDGFLKKGRTITAIKLLKDLGFTLKEAKDLVEKIIKKRYVDGKAVRFI